MTPNEQKAYEWEKEFDKEFSDITHFGCGSTPDCVCATLRYDLKSFIASQIAQARTDERRRIGKEISRIGTGLSSNPKDNTEYEKGYYGAIEDVLSLINKE